MNKNNCIALAMELFFEEVGLRHSMPLSQQVRWRKRTNLLVYFILSDGINIISQKLNYTNHQKTNTNKN